MRHQWRLLLLRTGARSPHLISTPSSLYQIGSSSNGHTIRSLYSLLHSQSLSPSPPPFTPSNLPNPINPRTLIARNFSSEPVSDQPVSEKPPSDEAVVADVFAKSSDPDEIQNLESSKIDITHDLVLRVCRIIRNQLWGDEVEGQLRDLNVTFSNNLVQIVLENLETVPMKALMYFRWVEESGLCKHDEQTYNAMARILGRGDCIARFWKLVDDMNGGGYEMEMETFDKVFVQLFNRKRIEDAVELYEFAMSSANSKPSVSCCTVLLKKIVVSKNLDMSLFSRVVKAFVAGGHKLSDSTLKAVLKSVTSVDRLGECNAILKAMEDGGYVMSGNWQRRVAFQLGSAGKKEEVSEFIHSAEASGSNSDYRVQISLIEGYCKAYELEKASDCLQSIIEKEGAFAATCAVVDILVNAYCRKSRAVDAFNLLCNLVSEKQLKPWHATYKVLISQLLVQGGFNNALNLLSLMKTDGFPPCVDPIIKYVSKSGSSDDAIALLKAMTSKKFPSKSVYLRLFEAFLKDGKRSKAQDFLSKCPGHIRNNADVLNLFCSTKPAKAAIPAPLAA